MRERNTDAARGKKVKNTRPTLATKRATLGTLPLAGPPASTSQAQQLPVLGNLNIHDASHSPDTSSLLAAVKC